MVGPIRRIVERDKRLHPSLIWFKPKEGINQQQEPLFSWETGFEFNLSSLELVTPFCEQLNEFELAQMSSWLPFAPDLNLKNPRAPPRKQEQGRKLKGKEYNREFSVILNLSKRNLLSTSNLSSFKFLVLLPLEQITDFPFGRAD